MIDELDVTLLKGTAGVPVVFTTGVTQPYTFRNNGRTFMLFSVAEGSVSVYTIFNRSTQAYEQVNVPEGLTVYGPFLRSLYNDRHDRVLMGIQIPAGNQAPDFAIFSI